MRILEPYRLWDMEVYSTLLWHLQRNIRLSFLAQELLSTDPKSPQAWIAVGNCFSLQKEKAQALTCFRRAAQLDPTCAYAYTLSGHESIDEDLNKAINFFQSALRADARHYNAWCVSSPAFSARPLLTVCCVPPTLFLSHADWFCVSQVRPGDVLYADEQVTSCRLPLPEGVGHPPAERGPPGLRGHGTCGHASMASITLLTATMIGAGTVHEVRRSARAVPPGHSILAGERARAVSSSENPYRTQEIHG